MGMNSKTVVKFGVETIDWKPIYFDSEQEMCDFFKKNPDYLVYPEEFNKDGRILMFIKKKE